MTDKNKTNPYVVIRAHSAGVHVGELAERRGQEVDLVNARRIWKWQGANTLNEIATSGVGKGSHVSVPVESITILQVIEVIKCTDKARESLESASWG